MTNSDTGKKESINSPRCKRAKTSAPVIPVGEEITCSPPIPPRPKQKLVVEQKLDDNWVETAGSDQNIAEDLSNRTTVLTDVTEISNQSDSNTTGTPSISLDLTSNPTDLTQGVVEPKGRNSSCNPKLYATCFVCGKQLSNQYNLRVHMETHQNAHYACSACNHVSRSRDALRKHVSYRHPQTPNAALQPAAAPRQP